MSKSLPGQVATARMLSTHINSMQSALADSSQLLLAHWQGYVIVPRDFEQVCAMSPPDMQQFCPPLRTR